MILIINNNHIVSLVKSIVSRVTRTTDGLVATELGTSSSMLSSFADTALAEVLTILDCTCKILLLLNIMLFDALVSTPISCVFNAFTTGLGAKDWLPMLEDGNEGLELAPKPLDELLDATA
jgi:hypothetical protein